LAISVTQDATEANFTNLLELCKQSKLGNLPVQQEDDPEDEGESEGEE
jgi:hypothetical protein